MTNKVVVSVPQPKFLINHSPVRDESLNFQVHNGTIEKKNKKKRKNKKCDFRVKTREGGLERKREYVKDLWAEQMEE